MVWNPFCTPNFASIVRGNETALDTSERTTKALVPRKLAAAAAAPAEGYSCEYGSGKYFALCGFGGVLSCGLTHTLVVPLDLVKCRIQVDAQKYKSIFGGMKVTVGEEGVRALARGWAPTLIGYSFQGLGKFGFYEVFKKTL